jgi:hypothetical protein
MVDEYWGTLSLYDHRKSMFVKSLVLFDRIIIPIPNKPVYDLTNQELDKLYADSSYLKKNNAAEIYDWDISEFQAWRDDFIRESLSAKSTDLLYDTRLMLAGKADTLKPKDVYDIVSVPIYGAREQFSDAYKTLMPVKENLIVELSQLISVPSADTPLENIIELRNRESFQSSRRALRDWQLKTLPELLTEKSEKHLILAKEDFMRMLKRYEEEMQKGNFKKTKLVVTSLLALGGLLEAATGHMPEAIAFMSGVAPSLFALKEATLPIWKDLRDKSFEPAGVIYEANEMFKHP